MFFALGVLIVLRGGSMKLNKTDSELPYRQIAVSYLKFVLILIAFALIYCGYAYFASLVSFRDISKYAVIKVYFDFGFFLGFSIVSTFLLIQFAIKIASEICVYRKILIDKSSN